MRRSKDDLHLWINFRNSLGALQPALTAQIDIHKYDIRS